MGSKLDRDVSYFELFKIVMSYDITQISFLISVSFLLSILLSWPIFAAKECLTVLLAFSAQEVRSILPSRVSLLKHFIGGRPANSVDFCRRTSLAPSVEETNTAMKQPSLTVNTPPYFCRKLQVTERSYKKGEFVSI